MTRPHEPCSLPQNPAGIGQRPKMGALSGVRELLRLGRRESEREDKTEGKESVHDGLQVWSPP